MMHALNVLPATLIYPTLGTTGVALNVILARQLWRERLLRRQVLGVVVAVLVVLLMNLDRSGSAVPGGGEDLIDGTPIKADR
jgi:multidrug transporter EmrE-like cation transporter